MKTVSNCESHIYVTGMFCNRGETAKMRKHGNFSGGNSNINLHMVGHSKQSMAWERAKDSHIQLFP